MNKLFRTFSALVSLGFLLGGCSAIPGLRMPASISITGNDVPTLIQSAQTVQTAYSTQIAQLSDDLQDSAKFNIIDGTALAAASIYHGNLNVLRFFGLAGGVNIATDATFNPSLQLNTYESGYSAISCMIDKAQALPTSQSNALMSLKNKNSLLSTAKTSLQSVAQAKPVAKEGKPGEAAQPAQADESKVNDALQAELRTADRILDAAIDVDTATVFKTNVSNLDHTVRKKLREALKAQQSTALRDELIAKAVEAEKNKDQAKKTEAAIKALNNLRVSPNIDVTTLASILGPAADIAAFDSDLKKCVASAGF